MQRETSRSDNTRSNDIPPKQNTEQGPRLTATQHRRRAGWITGRPVGGGHLPEGFDIDDPCNLRREAYDPPTVPDAEAIEKMKKGGKIQGGGKGGEVGGGRLPEDFDIGDPSNLRREAYNPLPTLDDKALERTKGRMQAIEKKEDQFILTRADKGKPQDSSEDLKKFLHNEFIEIGGNTSIEKADIIFIADEHGDTRHQYLRGQLIDMTANDGDVIILEGRPANEQSKAQEHSWLKRVAAKVIVVGGDNMNLHDQAKKLIKKSIGIVADIEKREKEDPTDPELERLNKEQEDIVQEVISIGVERGKTLKEVTISMEKRVPKPKIYVSFGGGHATDDNDFKGYMEQKQHIVLKPKYSFYGALSDEEELEFMTSQYSTLTFGDDR